MIKLIEDLEIEDELDLGSNFERLFLESPCDSSEYEIGIWKCKSQCSFHCGFVNFKKDELVMQIVFDGRFKWYRLDPKNKSIKECFEKYYIELSEKFEASLLD